MDEELKRYKDLVTQMFEIDSKEPFSNGQPSHAAVIFAEMLRRSKSHVMIFCKELAEDVFDKERDIIPALKAALSRNVDVSIIIQDEPKSAEFLNHARKFLEDRLLPGEVSVIGCGALPELDVIRNLPWNFAVMDGKATRTELDKGVVQATACANDPATAKDLIATFKKIQRFLRACGNGVDYLAPNAPSLA